MSNREQLRRWMTRAGFADGRILGPADCRRDPYAALPVEHRVVHVVPARPDRLVPPVRRRLRHVGRGSRRRGIAHRQRYLRSRVAHGVQHRQIVCAQLERPIDQSVPVCRRMTSVGGHFIVQVGFGIGPVPLGDDHVALDAAGTMRRRRHFTLRDAIGPVGKHRDRARPQLIHPADHAGAGLSRLNAPRPRRFGRGERSERRGNLACRLVAELMTCPAAARLHVAQPLCLTSNLRRDAVSGCPRELILRRRAQQRKPRPGRIVLRGLVWIRGGHGREIDIVSRR